MQVHDSLASAPPNNVHMLSRADIDTTETTDTTDVPESGEDSARLITGAAGGPSDARSHKGGYSDLDNAAKYGYGTSAQLPRPAKHSKHSRNWAGSKNIIDYFVLRAHPSP